LSAPFPSLPALARSVRTGAGTAAEILENALARVEASNDRLGAFLTVAADRAREEAAAIDAAVARGEDPGPLAGVPLAVKDNISTAGIRTTCASRLLQDFVPVYDATVVTRLRRAGAVILGKTNLDEFGMGSSNEASAVRPVVNPWAEDRVAGGSSGGSAAAVSAGLAAAALGSDTGGSVRQPAAFCGVVGYKPSYGYVSRYGLIAYASSLEQIGGFAGDVESLVLLHDTLAGADPRDATSVSRRSADRISSPDTGWRVGVAEGLLAYPGVEPAVAAGVSEAARLLGERGTRAKVVDLPDPERAVAAYYLIATAEASSNLARYDGVRYGRAEKGDGLEEMMRMTRARGFGTEVKRRILLGTYVLSAGYYDAYYGRAQRARHALRDAFAALLDEVDLILLPTTPTTAFPLGEKLQDPLAMYASDVFTVYANLVGLPALSLPIARDEQGLPVGVQLLAAPGGEDVLFAAARALEEARGPFPWAPRPGEEGA
jgi:aspartyl-tRNA(Asn)/glutamyl-tRNA(Gln) amidotransferase subunit A